MPSSHEIKDIATLRAKALEARENAVKTREETVDAEVERRVRDLRDELATTIAAAKERERKEAERAAQDETTKRRAEKLAVETAQLHKDMELGKALVDFIVAQNHPHMDGLHHGVGFTALALGGHVAHKNGWSITMFCMVIYKIFNRVCDHALADLRSALAKGFERRLVPATVIPAFPGDLDALREPVRRQVAAVPDPTPVVPADQPIRVSNKFMAAVSLAGIHVSAWDMVRGQMTAWMDALYRNAMNNPPPFQFDMDKVMAVWQERVVDPFGDEWATICDPNAP